MTWRTHALIGVSSLWLLAPFQEALTPYTIGPLCAIAAFGALLPDLDASESKIKSLKVGSVRPFAPLSVLAHRSWGHRALLHSPLGLLLFGVACAVLGLSTSPLAALALWLGYASHLAADACTPSGIPTWPNRAQPRLYLVPPRARITTGSLAEERLLLLAVPVLLLLLSRLPHR